MLLGESYSDAYVQGGDWQTGKDWSWGIHVQGGGAPEENTESIVAAVQRAARKSVASVADEGQAFMAAPTASVWLWLLGIALVGGGAYLYLSRRKRR